MTSALAIPPVIARLATGAVVAACFVATFCASSLRAETAVLVVGDGFTAPELDALDAQLRSATKAGETLPELAALQAVDVTRARIASAGLTCDWRDVDCLAQLGVLCGTDRIVLVDASRPASSIALTIVDVNAGKATRRAAAPGTDVAAALAALRLPAAGNAALGNGTPSASGSGSSSSSSSSAGGSIVPLVGVGVGAVALLAGAGFGVTGALAWFERDATRTTLLATEAEADAANLSDPAFIARVRDERNAFDRADTNWETSGQPLVTAGSLALGAGVGLVAISVAWMVSE